MPLEVRTAATCWGSRSGCRCRAREGHEEAEHRIALKVIQGKLLAYMSVEASFAEGLVKHGREFLEMAGAAGAGAVFQNEAHLAGETPTPEQVKGIAEWLGEDGGRGGVRDELAVGGVSGAGEFAARASGLLAISVSKIHRSYVMWFRPEVVETVKWGGDPRKAAEPVPGDVRLHPRKSFETWKETVRLRSERWRQSEVETAAELRNSIVGIVLRRAEEMAELTAELEVSNKELESFSYSVSHDLRSPFRHIVGYGELLREVDGAAMSETGRRYVETMIESCNSRGGWWTIC